MSITVDDILTVTRQLKSAWARSRKDALLRGSCFIAPVAEGVRLYEPLRLPWQRSTDDDGNLVFRTAR